MPELTVVVPTFNRSQHLARCLRHFVVDENDLHIIIADGSNVPEHRRKNEASVMRVKSDLNIEYIGFPSELGFFQRCSEVADQISTEYIVFHADDDFLFSSGMIAAAEFMDNNSEVTVTQGNIMHIGRGKNKLMNVATYPFSPIAIQDPVKRLKWHMRGYRPTFYSTHRRKNCAEALAATSKFTSPWLRFTEITASSLIALQGQLGFVDVLYGVRESHPGALSRNDMNWPDILVHDNFSKTLQDYVDVVGPFIEEMNACCSPVDADKQAREAFLEFMKMVMIPQTRPIPQHIIDQTRSVLDIFENHSRHDNQRRLLSNAIALINDPEYKRKSTIKSAILSSIPYKSLLRGFSKKFRLN
ncbi:MAG: hypothetical protein COB29_00825 [Sulfitobacter sp.]|nr:MAG: hypothetical protein COB29_00825 [Sulfitobacter sp.]